MNPLLVYVDATSFGATGPLRAWRGFGTQMEAFAGHELLRTYRDLDVDKNTWAVTADSAGALAIALAAQAGLYARRHTGRGQYVDISITENFLGLIGAAVLDYTTTAASSRRSATATTPRCRAAIPAPATTAGSSSRSATTTTGPAFSAPPPGSRRSGRDGRVALRAPRRARRAAAAWTSGLSREEAVDGSGRRAFPPGRYSTTRTPTPTRTSPSAASSGRSRRQETGTYLYPGAPYKFRNVTLEARLPPSGSASTTSRLAGAGRAVRGGVRGARGRRPDLDGVRAGGQVIKSAEDP